MKTQILLLLFTAMPLLGCKEKQNASDRIDSDPKASDELPAEASKNSESSIQITPIEHATAIIEWNNVIIYVDPVGGANAFDSQKSPDLILITDIHGDHLDVATLEELNTSKTKIMVPQAVADRMPEEFTSQIDVLHNGDTKEHYGITVEAIPMYNLREQAKKFHEKGRGNGYVLNLGVEKLYISGDTEDIPEMRNLKNIDIALICMNLPYTMTVESAANAVLAFKPHKGVSLPLSRATQC